MKNYLYIFLISSVFIITSCSDEPTNSNPLKNLPEKSVSSTEGKLEEEELPVTPDAKKENEITSPSFSPPQKIKTSKPPSKRLSGG